MSFGSISPVELGFLVGLFPSVSMVIASFASSYFEPTPSTEA